MPKFKPKYSRVAQLKTAEEFTTYAANAGAIIPFDEHLIEPSQSPYAETITLKTGRTIGNKLCILPMEGWDGTPDGRPTVHTRRRWEKFAISGAKLLFGCEAVAVRHDAKANPLQLVMNEANFQDFVDLRNLIFEKHAERFGSTDDLVVGLQLTHSGRFSKPYSQTKFESKTLYEHPFLDAKFHVDPAKQILTDEQIEEIIDDYINASVLAQKAGFHFVDVKHCHGYLGHEFLTAIDRPGPYGGSFENRTRYFRNIVAGIRAKAPGLEIGVRLSAFDFIPFKKGAEDLGTPETAEHYPYAFGADDTGLNLDHKELFDFIALAENLGVQMICVTGGSPYYTPHLIRPATFPPSDGYLPPEEPLLGVARHIHVTDILKKQFPDMVFIGSGYSYLQDWLPNVGQAVLRQNMADSIGFGRMVLSYPEMPADILAGKPMVRNLICRTFSDCTTAPRNGMISGCFPLDTYYKKMPEAEQLKALK